MVGAEAASPQPTRPSRASTRTSRFSALAMVTPAIFIGVLSGNATGMASTRRIVSALLDRSGVVKGLQLPDLAQNVGRVLAKPRRGAIGGHRPAADHDRRADAGDLSVLGGVARKLEPHAAVNDLRIGEHVVEIVDRSSRYADGFELRQKIGALHPLGQFGELPHELFAMRQSSR